MDIFSLEGKVAIVTGCRTGLGQSMAIALAKAGADILGVGSTDLDETKSLVEKTGRKFVGVQANLMEMSSIPKVMEAAMDNFGKVDILVNNAGIIRREDSINFSEKDWDDVMNINLKMVFFLSQAVAKKFIEQRTGGKIINIASMLSFQGGIRVPSYTGSKSGVKGLTMLMANEWAKYNINTNAIAPGYMATDNTAALRADEGRSSEILSRIPANRWGTPEDLDGTVVFLASKASDYVNGFTIAVDGGWLAR
ncbi:2-deoxy-D-gluconate 3-dehydrogenase [Natronincola peptidivorans]|uniref:2-dehydro-3-deoxy-D-gluconate 5-dehydrogenase n=1 Tax=Natronincola peptidivorans TaxID=426128 RepID=A0A1I0E1X1_9FIRM|nr:2-dehydro-3-deoxy-D-gluconate 5-dehydrogenase KduD [Natronincola peptidivorans]SET38324.1 2-deoxy-D-gluconate 3-dehydrogenase [Natronincola peptidivorans]